MLCSDLNASDTRWVKGQNFIHLGQADPELYPAGPDSQVRTGLREQQHSYDVLFDYYLQTWLHHFTPQTLLIIKDFTEDTDNLIKL